MRSNACNKRPTLSDPLPRVALRQAAKYLSTNVPTVDNNLEVPAGGGAAAALVASVHGSTCLAM